MSLARVIRAVTTLIVAPALMVLGTAAAASAGTAPDTWPEGETLSTLETLAWFVLLPLGLAAVIGIIAAAVAARSHNFVPTPPSTEVEPAPQKDPTH